ncbi:hypothetical protein A0H81_14223 [Grifola frondosa]|uniref:Uncharacterized protein n=1 Tax=Grifola frondosa TaxID=5627 RepID=A0A1C7LML2_GRIFR|nr:hypothetical protein A0H81_14223 [Grifola frondosa]
MHPALCGCDGFISTSTKFHQGPSLSSFSAVIDLPLCRRTNADGTGKWRCMIDWFSYTQRFHGRISEFHLHVSLVRLTVQLCAISIYVHGS